MRFRLSDILRIPLHNKGLKLLSLLLAIVTWFAIQTVTSFENLIVDVPLKIDVDDGWAVLDRSTDKVDVFFRGSQEDLLRLSREHVDVVVDVRGKAAEGSVVVPITADDVRIPGGSQVVYIRPSEIMLSLDREAEKQVPVKAETVNRPPEGFEVVRLVADPASVTLTGPRKRIKDIDSIFTEPIDMSKRTRTFRERLAVQPPSDTWVARIDPPRVNIEVSMIQRAERRLIEDIEVAVLQASDSEFEVSTRQDRVGVEFEGQAERLERLSADDIYAYVDCLNLESAGRYELPVRIHAPENVTVADVKPTAIGVIVNLR